MRCARRVLESHLAPRGCGDAAISIDPEDTKAMVDAIRRVLTDTELSAQLRVRSLARAAQFSWQKAASETLEVYENMYSRRKK